MNKILYFLTILLFTIFTVIITANVLYFKKDFSNVNPYKIMHTNNYLNLNNYLFYNNNYTADDRFPFNLYLSSDNYKDINQINRDIYIMDSLYPDFINKNKEVIATTLTDSLQKLKYYELSAINLDSISYLMQWTKGFMYYSMENNKNQNLYASIHDYWMNYISNYLTTYSENNKDAKFNNNFTYLVNQCEEGKYNVAIKVNSLEKVVYNLTNNYYGHLVNASWNQSSNLEKLVFTFIILFTLYSYYYLITKILRKK